MDHQRFDALTRALAGGQSRRRLLKLITGGLVGGLFLAEQRVAPVAAACKTRFASCSSDAECCFGCKDTSQCAGAPIGGACAASFDCDGAGVEGFTTVECRGGICCGNASYLCTGSGECCSGLTCSGSVCSNDATTTTTPAPTTTTTSAPTTTSTTAAPVCKSLGQGCGVGGGGGVCCADLVCDYPTCVAATTTSTTSAPTTTTSTTDGPTTSTTGAPSTTAEPTTSTPDPGTTADPNAGGDSGAQGTSGTSSANTVAAALPSTGTGSGSGASDAGEVGSLAVFAAAAAVLAARMRRTAEKPQP